MSVMASLVGGGGLELVSGEYTGNGSSQTINLGFRPKGVFVCTNSVIYGACYFVANSQKLTGNYQSETALSITENGFSVFAPAGTAAITPNGTNVLYNYIVFK